MTTMTIPERFITDPEKLACFILENIFFDPSTHFVCLSLDEIIERCNDKKVGFRHESLIALINDLLKNGTLQVVGITTPKIVGNQQVKVLHVPDGVAARTYTVPWPSLVTKFIRRLYHSSDLD